MPSANDWAAKAARRILDEYGVKRWTKAEWARQRESRRGHYHCDDSWYCCRACRAADHQLADGEHLGRNGESVLCDGRCTCGADTWNALVDAVLDGRRS
ncbi:MAG: hypothetical protein NUV51_09555 [Sulfuricaulis sp.]|nr:hypothetical protein [Sulfuricaulis sp.]